jgi:2-phospho-L-lactate guanylyltransferase (CobY/MobA/RfbA family)
LTRPEKTKVTRTLQQQATANMARSEKVLDDKLRQLTRLVTSIREWRRKVAYYAQRAVLTDADLDAMRAARIERVAKRKRSRRSIALKGNIQG